ncbi:NCS2 family permease [Brassicibacter mesophilus]|uniref:NCS2 family permease n=1 Tax=Brassicibacter mesophilus TaxID=745119 RepID=UPI003D212177
MGSNTKKTDSFVERYFELSKYGTDVKTEIIAGITTFVTMAYVLLVIPNLLKAAGLNAAGVVGDAASEFTIFNDPVVASIFAATCLISAYGTLSMGLYAKLPFATAPGLGLSAFFAYSVVLTLGYTWQQGIAAVMISGILFIIITVTSIREKIIDSLPQNIKTAISAGVGLFIALIGLKSGGIIISNPATLVGFGDFTNAGVALTLIGLMITVVLMARNVKGAILISIILTTIIGIPLGVTNIEGIKIFTAPPSIAPTFMKWDFKGLLGNGEVGVAGALLNIVMVVMTISFVDLFDNIGTLLGTAQKGNMIEPDGKVRNMNRALLSDSIATTLSSFLGTTTTSTYVESTAGIAEGGRTGLTSVVTGVLFLASLFFAGVIGVVPTQATAPALIVVGVLMIQSIVKIDFTDFTEAVPAFFTIAMMPFTFSIANGVAAGIIFYPIMKIFTGRHKEVNPIMYILAVMFIIRFTLLPN